MVPAGSAVGGGAGRADRNGRGAPRLGLPGRRATSRTYAVSPHTRWQSVANFERRFERKPETPSLSTQSYGPKTIWATSARTSAGVFVSAKYERFALGLPA